MGLGAFLSSIAYVYSQSISQGSTNYYVYVAGFFALGLALILGGVLKIVNAFSSAREDKVSTLKTPVAAAVIGLVAVYYGLAFFYRF